MMGKTWNVLLGYCCDMDSMKSLSKGTITEISTVSGLQIALDINSKTRRIMVYFAVCDIKICLQTVYYVGILYTQ